MFQQLSVFWPRTASVTLGPFVADSRRREIPECFHVRQARRR